MTESISARLHRGYRAATRPPAATAFSGPEPVTYADLERLIGGYAAGVCNWGVARGESVGIVAPKTARAIAAYFGAMQAGACVCFIDPGLATGADCRAGGRRRHAPPRRRREPDRSRSIERSCAVWRCADCIPWTRAAPSSTADSGARTARCCCSPRAAPAAPRACSCATAA